MSGVLQRTIFINRGIDGFMRMADWSLVTTTLGSMFEPVSFQPKLGLTDDNGYVASDMCSRIDRISNHDPGAQIFGDNGSIGGGLVPVFNY